MRFNTPIAKTLWEARTWLTPHPTSYEDKSRRVRYTCNAISRAENFTGTAREWYENWLRGQAEFTGSIPSEWNSAVGVQEWRFDFLTLAALVAKEEGV